MATRAVVLDVGGVLAHNMWEPMLDDLAQRYHLGREEMRFFSPQNIILSSRIGAPKESPRLEMFRAAVAAAGAPAPACFYVDDRPAIVERALAFGLDAVLFRGPDAFADELRKRALL